MGTSHIKSFHSSKPAPTQYLNVGSLTLNLSKLSTCLRKDKEKIIEKLKRIKLQDQYLDLLDIDEQLFQYVKTCKQRYAVMNISVYDTIQYVQLKTKKQQFWNHPPILPFIIHINFPNLEYLKITSYQLHNVQGFQFIVAPNLRCLQIHNRQLVSVKSMSKASFPKLQSVSLYKNQLNSLNGLNRGHYKKLTNYQVDSFQQGIYDRGLLYDREHIMHDVSFLFKMENVNLKKLFAESKKRIVPMNSQKIFYRLNIKANIKVTNKYIQMDKLMSMDQYDRQHYLYQSRNVD